MPEPPAGGMEPEVRKKCFQAALLPDFNIRDGVMERGQGGSKQRNWVTREQSELHSGLERQR